MTQLIASALVAACALLLTWHAAAAIPPTVPEDVHKTELISFPGPWGFTFPRAGVILVSDQQLRDLAEDPDKVVDLSITAERKQSLRQVCEGLAARGGQTLIVAFDHFFAQYRPGQHEPRELMPDSQEYIDLIARISEFAKQYGIGLELSLLSPLEIGPSYQEETGESGRWMQFRKGVRDPETGAYSVQLWERTRWVNNKGPIDIEAADVRVFAFPTDRVGGANAIAVDPEAIVDITGTAQVERWEAAGDESRRRTRIYGDGRTELEECDAVLVVQSYRVPEMDYFSDDALPFLKKLVDRYVDAGVELNAFYSDEMHIQQDWGYFNNHDNGEFAFLYVTDDLAQAYAERYGAEYEDFAQYLVYFAYGQEDSATDVRAKLGWQHVMGDSPEAIRETALFRARYYHLLQDSVADLFLKAKRHAEERYGRRLHTRAHATWAESPTIDYWETGRRPSNRLKYEYTSDFVWSNTVHQAASACFDYFKWGEFLTGTGNDHAEGGWLDRNYYGLALGCSTGVINEIPFSYAAHWGMPREVSELRNHLVHAYGTQGAWAFNNVHDAQHRDVDVLMLYPLDLVASEPRFGSWMTQYGYANYLSQAKAVEMGTVKGGKLHIADRSYSTLVALFEPFPSERLLGMMKRLAESGGRVVWSGPPPVLTAEGGDGLTSWSELFGVNYEPAAAEGLRAPGSVVEFEGPLEDVPPQTVLTGYLVDRVYAVEPRDGAAEAARCDTWTVGAHRALDGGGSATYLGFRPRDDQAASLGYETRTWFETLSALGAYPPTGAFEGVNDNTEYVSRTTDVLACRFPNGATGLAPHFRRFEEGWTGGFQRDREEDLAYLAERPAPEGRLTIDGLKVNGHEVTYDGLGAVLFRVDDGALIAFAGKDCDSITIDGRTTVFADRKLPEVAWMPVPQERRVEGGAVLMVMTRGEGTLTLPSAGLPKKMAFYAEGAKPGSKGDLLAEAETAPGAPFTIEVPAGALHRWIYGVAMEE